jgi:alpha-glucoside transport system substrate-binding protein
MRPRTRIRAVALTSAAALALWGCLGQEDEGDQRVEIFGGITGEEEAGLVREAVAEIAEATGIDVRYEPSRDFSTLIRSRVRGGDAPEIALFPQPGLLLDMSPDLAPFDEAGIDVEALSGTLIPGFLDSATRDGQVYGAPVNMAVKSLVWYPKQAFEDAGYEVPETHAELLELSDQIVSDGGTPWCVGIESGPDTGWPATDWLEDYVLRTAGPDAYDQWVAGELGFASPEVTEAAETAGDILLNDDYVDGGGRAIVNTPFGDAPRDMFDEEPGCWLHRQASFITTFFPEEVQEDLDEVAGVFMLPPVEGGFDGTPVLGSGDFAALFDADNDNAVEVMEYLTSDRFGGPWARGGGFQSPHTTFDVGEYPDETTREIAEQTNDADVFRFDGSDLMPGAVGTGSFWEGMVDWIGGRKDLDEVLSDIDDSWPQ